MKYSSKYELLTIFSVYVNIIYMNSILKTKFKTKLCEVKYLNDQKIKILYYKYYEYFKRSNTTPKN